jgi:hypothetical protein
MAGKPIVLLILLKANINEQQTKSSLADRLAAKSKIQTTGSQEVSQRHCRKHCGLGDYMKVGGIGI